MLGRDPENAPQKRAIPQTRAGRTGSPRDGKRSTCTANPEFTRNLTEHGQRGVHTKTAKGKDTRDALTVMRKFNQNDERKMEVEYLPTRKRHRPEEDLT